MLGILVDQSVRLLVKFETNTNMGLTVLGTPHSLLHAIVGR